MRSFIWMDLKGLRCNEVEVVKKMEVNKYLTVTCDNERQKMLCEQVIRMDRGEKSQYHYGANGEWMNTPVDAGIIHINSSYRAKPKKGLVVPWDILADEVEEIRVDSNGCIYDGNTPLRIKLDLADIELPVTVKRPESK